MAQNMNNSIEETLAHLMNTVEELSDIVARQDGEIIRLTHMVDMLATRERERAADQGGGVIFADERPPHY